jgi:flavodoxin
MKALLIYFSMTGRTKRMASAIANALSNYEVSFFPVELAFTGGFNKRIKTFFQYNGGDTSLLKTDLGSLNAKGYDLIIIGMPTIAGKPPHIFYDITSRIKNFSGKKVIVFGTSRIYRGKMVDEMKSETEARGGHVLAYNNFKGLFMLREKNAFRFGEMINSIS